MKRRGRSENAIRPGLWNPTRDYGDGKNLIICILVHISWPDRHVYFYRDYTRIFSPNRTRQLGLLACRKACRDPYSTAAAGRNVECGRQKHWEVGRNGDGTFLKRVLHEVFVFRFLSWISFPRAPEYPSNSSSHPTRMLFSISNFTKIRGDIRNFVLQLAYASKWTLSKIHYMSLNLNPTACQQNKKKLPV